MRSCMLLSDDGACSFATLRTLVNLLSLLGGARVLSVSAYVGIGTVTTAPARGRARADTAASSMLHALNVIETLPARGGEGGEGGRGGKRGVSYVTVTCTARGNCVLLLASLSVY